MAFCFQTAKWILKVSWKWNPKRFVFLPALGRSELFTATSSSRGGAGEEVWGHRDDTGMGSGNRGLQEMPGEAVERGCPGVLGAGRTNICQAGLELSRFCWRQVLLHLSDLSGSLRPHAQRSCFSSITNVSPALPSLCQSSFISSLLIIFSNLFYSCSFH